MELNIKQIFLIILKKIPTIISCALLLGLLSFLYTNFFVVPLYSSTAMLSVQANENRENYKSVSSGDYSVSVELVSTISELIKNEACIHMVDEITGLGSKYSSGQIKSMLSVTSSGTENFILKVSSPNPEHSLVLVNAFAEVISDATFIDGNIVNADPKDPTRGYIKKILKAGTVTLISGATKIPLSPSSPNTSRNTFTGFAVGLVLSTLFFILKDLINSRVLTESDMDDLFPEIPSLGAVPVISKEKGREKDA